MKNFINRNITIVIASFLVTILPHNLFAMNPNSDIPQHADSTKSDDNYYLTKSMNLNIGYNSTDDWRLQYFPDIHYKYFLNINYQLYTSFSDKSNEATYGLLNEIGINSTQVYYKFGLRYYIHSNIYFNGNIGLGYTPYIGGQILNNFLIGTKHKLNNNIFLQIEGGADNLIKFGLPFNLFVKIGFGFSL